ncbi:MAG: PLP-dependent aminotransferase family protein [Herpetosiphon sp.]
MRIEIDREARLPLYLQVVEQIKERIRSGGLVAGTRLPTVRQFAEELQLTRLTVHNAYTELQADGWIESFVGRGSFVAARPALDDHARPGSAAPLEVRVPGELADLMRLAQQPEIISFAQAAAAPETFPRREFARAVQQVLAHAGAAVYGYGPSQGEQELRNQFAGFLLERSVQAAPEQIIVVGGAQQGLDIVLRALLRPGDSVLVEQPTYLGMIERLEATGLAMHGVAMDEEGMRLDVLESLIRAQKPRLLYTIPTFHNPTGRSMSEARRSGVLDLCERYGLTILEDDIYGLLSFDGPAPLPLKAHDHAGLVIYLTSFSKVLMPGLRIGLLAVPDRLRGALIAVKQMTDLHSPQLMQLALASFLQGGHLNAHLRATRALYRERRDVLLAELRRSFPAETSWYVPAGGLCVWVQLPSGVRSMELYLAAIDRGVAFAPGEAFFCSQPTAGFMRLSWADHEPAVLVKGIQILGGLVHEYASRYRRLCLPSPQPICPLV